MAKDKSIKVDRPASKNAPTGWFSRRHPTSEAHEKAQATWRKSQAEKVARDMEAASSAPITSSVEFAQEQLEILDEEGHRAVRERQRLAKVLAPKKAA